MQKYHNCQNIFKIILNNKLKLMKAKLVNKIFKTFFQIKFKIIFIISIIYKTNKVDKIYKVKNLIIGTLYQNLIIQRRKNKNKKLVLEKEKIECK